MKYLFAAPFERDHLIDKPGIVGARWWQQSLVEEEKVGARRDVLTKLLVAGGALGVLGMVIASANNEDTPSPNQADTPVGGVRSALDMQREFGWSFGADTEQLTFDGASTLPFDRSALARMPDDLRPARPDLLPYYLPTLFQSPSAKPSASPLGETGGPTPLGEALRPIISTAMESAYRRGQGLASLFRPDPAGVALVIDLEGPASVAFAAGAFAIFDPVFGFDNWPHPRGVVPAHLTLGAAAYYQPLFARKKAGNEHPAMFVLDRARLARYVDDGARFDNRYVAKLPPAAALLTLGIKRVLYVVPTLAETIELDDLNDDFVMYAAAGVDVKLVAASSFAPDPQDPGNATDGPPHHYGGSARSHAAFWSDYGWSSPPAPKNDPPVTLTPGIAYTPIPRATNYSSGRVGGSPTRPRPANFGTVGVMMAGASGAILGASMSRSGSWNRSSGGSGA